MLKIDGMGWEDAVKKSFQKKKPAGGSEVGLSMRDSWLIPWEPIVGASSDDGLAVELREEVGMDHVLYGIAVRPIGFRIDCDDALFELLDGSGRLAVVHLAFALHPEPNPLYPTTEVFADWPTFVETRMKPDALEFA